MPLSQAVSIRVMWEAICFHGWGDCWQAALIPHAVGGNSGKMLVEGWQDPTEFSCMLQETRSMHLEIDQCLQGSWGEGKQPPRPAWFPVRTLDLG